jgi:hypothetical protein
MRSYRTGELPDIQISYSDVIRPLRNLCYRDEVFARSFVVEMSTAIAKVSKQAAADLKRSLVKTVNQVPRSLVFSKATTPAEFDHTTHNSA